VRLDLLLQMGGLYLDTDLIPLRSFDDLFAEGKPVLGFQKQISHTSKPWSEICNAFILAPPNAEFIQKWNDEYHTSFEAGCWGCNSLAVPGFLTWSYPNLVRVLPRSQLFYPDWTMCNEIFSPAGYSKNTLTNHYGLHLWSKICTRKYNMTLEYVRQNNSVFSEIARPFVTDVYLAQLDNCSGQGCPYLSPLPDLTT